MIRVAGIRFQQDGKMFFYDAGSIDLQVGDFVVAETERGIELGEVMLGIRETEEDQTQTDIPKIIRAATAQDVQQATETRNREKEAFRICQKKIAEHKLEMKLVSVESTFDNSKMLFYFTANGRVDFRALVKDLASTFRTRIELRQIGVRDEARMLGGLGPCGRQICCGTFLSDFQPVSIKMAKEQSLSLNPTKISGVCGRLMCCLKYEQDQYEAVRKKMPKVGREVSTPDGQGTVVELNVVKETVTVRIPNGDSSENRTYPLEQIARPGRENREESALPEKEEGTAEAADTEPQEMPEELKALQEDEPKPEKETAEKTKPQKPRKSRAERNAFRAGRNGETSKEKPDPEQTARPQKTLKNKNGQSEKQADKPEKQQERQPEKGRKLGQPVRRENPERGRNAQGRGDQRQTGGQPVREKTAAEGSTPKTEVKPKALKANGWAEALEKAMKAADQ